MAGSEHTAGSGGSPVPGPAPADVRGTRQWLLLVVAFAAVIGTDQAMKWWAWRHLDGSLINSGGYILLGPVIRSWFASPVSGAMADVLGAAFVIVGVWWLLLRRRARWVLIGGGLFAAGWASNLLDRLGLHNWTAPGSARGVVDFIPGGGPGRCNVADLWIVVGALLLGGVFARNRLTDEPRDRIAPGSALRSSGGNRARGRLVVLIVLLAVITLAVTSALDQGGVYSPPA
jgi:lipoprotein signal peptidase